VHAGSTPPGQLDERYRALLEPLPVPRPHELYRIGNADDCCVNGGLPSGAFSLFSYDLYLHLRDAAPQFSELAAFQANPNTLTVGRTDAGVPPETSRASFVSGNYFAMFDLAPGSQLTVQSWIDAESHGGTGAFDGGRVEISLRGGPWIPLAVDSKAAGVFWGALTAGVDAVGRDAYLIAGLVADTRRAQGSFGYVTHRLGNPTLDVSAANDWSHIGSSLGRDLLINEVDAALGATFVAQRWRRAASVRIAAEYEGERFATSPDTLPPAVCAGCVSRDLVGGSVVVALGHVTGGPLAISAQDGAGLTLLYPTVRWTWWRSSPSERRSISLPSRIASPGDRRPRSSAMGGEAWCNLGSGEHGRAASQPLLWAASSGTSFSSSRPTLS